MWSFACLLLRVALLLLTTAAPVPHLPGAARYTGYNCYEGYGGESLDADSGYGDPFPEPLTPEQCYQRCVKDHRCDGFLVDGRHVRPGEPAEGPCWLRAALKVEECKGTDSKLEPYDLFVITERGSQSISQSDESSDGVEGHVVDSREQHHRFADGRELHRRECEREFVTCLRVTDEERTEHMHTCDRELRACIREAEKEGHEAGEEHEAPLEDIETSFMLIVFLVLIMFAFFLVNYRDNDIRLYAWKILSSTISIFTSILVFQGLNGFGELFCQSAALLLLYQTTIFAVAVALLQITILCTAGLFCTTLEEGDLEKEKWVFVDVTRGEHDQPLAQEQLHQLNLQVAKRPRASRAAEESPGKRVFRDPADGSERFVQRKPLEKMWRKQWAKGFGMLFGHLAGFAAISAGSTLQHSESFSSSGITALLPVAIVALLFWVSFNITQLVRERCFSMRCAESAHERIVEEAAEDGENDAAALAVSFLLVVAVRYVLVGQLADHDGIEFFESRAATPEAWQVAALALVGVAFLAIGVITVVFSARDKRVIHVVEAGSLMTFAWAMLFSVRWWALRWHLFFFKSIMGRFVVAALCTLCTGGVIWILDRIDDNIESILGRKSGTDVHGRRARKFLDLLISAFGVLIGFSWELCFEGAVHDVAAMTPFPLVVDLSISVVLTCIIIFPWSSYILLKVVLLERVRAAKQNQPPSEQLFQSTTASNWL